MNEVELRNKLAIKDGKVTIARNTLTSSFRDLLASAYSNQPVVIAGATQAGGGNGELALSGKSSFLGVADLPVAASFHADDRGEVQGLLRYQLREDAIAGPNAWTFTRSFPTLPMVLNYDTQLPADFDENTNIYAGQRPYLDALDLSDTWFVVSTEECEDPERKLPLQEGINFVSKMRPEGMLGVLEYAAKDGGKALTLYGAIRVPTQTERTLPLEPGQRQWDRPDAPGIHLLAPLDLDFKLGKASFSEAVLRVYSPPSSEWMQKNNTFRPALGYQAKLSIPSADIEIDLGADLEWGMPEARLYAKCEGITLGKLADLMDIAGTDGLSASLPKELQKAVEALNGLALTFIALDVGLAGTVPTIGGVTFTIGMPDLEWKVWKDHVVVSDIACRFDIDNPFPTTSGVKPSVGVTVMGTVEIEGVPLFISAQSAHGFTLYAKLDGGKTIPLKKLMQRYLPGVPAPSDLTIDRAMLTVAPGRIYAMSMSLAGEPNPWVIPLGKKDLTISDVMFDFSSPSGGPVSGSFAGTVALGKNLSLNINYDIPGSFMLRGDFYDVELGRLISELCSQKGKMPDGFDLSFDHASVLIQKQDKTYSLQLGAEMADAGMFAFEVRKVGAQWGFAGGFSLTGSPSKLSGLKGLEVLEKAFKLERFLLVISSFDAASFQFPDMAQFNNPAIAGKGNIALPAQAGGLTAGTYVFAEWEINTKDKQQKLLKTLLGASPTLGVSVYLGKNPANDMRMFVNYETKLQGHPMTCQFGVIVRNRQTSLFLNGRMTFKIQKQPVSFDVTMLFVPTGAFLSGTMLGTVDFGGLKLSNTAIMIVAPWTGIPSLGIAATISTKRFSSSVALFFDSADPSKSVLAGSVSDLNLKDVAEELSGSKLPAGMGDVLAGIGVEGTNAFTMPGSVSTALDDLDIAKVSEAFQSNGKVRIPSSASQVLLVIGKKGATWFLTDMANNMRHYQIVKKGNTITVTEDCQIYNAPQTTNLGTIVYREGFFLNGTLRVLGLEATSRIEVNSAKGIAIDSSINKALIIDNKQFFRLAAAQGGGGPELSIATFRQPNHKVAEFRSPHIYVNGELGLLGLTATCFVEITKSGGKFMIAQTATSTMKGGVIKAAVSNTWSIEGQVGAKVLAAGGSVTVAIDGSMSLKNLMGPAAKEMGSLKLKLSVACAADASYGNGKASASLEGSCSYQGEKIRFKTKMSTNAPSLGEVEKIVEKELEKAFKELLSVGEKWAKWANKGLVDGVKDVKQAARVMSDVYDKSAEETAKALQAAGHTVDAVGDALDDTFDIGEDDLKDVLKGAGYTAKSVDNYAGKKFKSATKAVSKTASSAKKSANKAGKKVGKAFGRKKHHKKM